jgi:hypothetical protein
VSGAVAGAWGSFQGGWNFDPRTSTNTFGPKAVQLYQQTAIGAGLDTTAGLARFASLRGRKDPRACQ